MMDDSKLREQLSEMITAGHAHAPLSVVTADIPFADLGKMPEQIPYSIWQQVEHVRIAQKDIVDFTLNENYQELNWPADYWPAEKAPAEIEAWENSLNDLQNDAQRMQNHLLDPKNDLYQPFPYGTGQNLLREAIVLADHNAYHIGQIVFLRKFLGNWE